MFAGIFFIGVVIFQTLFIIIYFIRQCSIYTVYAYLKNVIMILYYL